jgi:hypothetical protein
MYVLPLLGQVIHLLDVLVPLVNSIIRWRGSVSLVLLEVLKLQLELGIAYLLLVGLEHI